MFIAYICGWVPSSLLGRADKFIFKRSGDKALTCPWWQKAVNKAILGYADQQILTGVAMLAAGFIKVPTLSVYHLQVIIYLAWMSSNTHLSAISLLQNDFRSQKGPKSRVLRIVGMVIVGIMILVALVPTTGTTWAAVSFIGEAAAAGVPARCFWQHQFSGIFRPNAVLSYILLIGSFVWKGLLLFKTSHQFMKIRLRRIFLTKLVERLDLIHQQIKDKRVVSTWMKLRYKLSLSLYLIVWYVWEISESFVISLWICGGGLAWGSAQILVIRSTLPRPILKEENSWGFGQILPVLLLGLPVLAYAEGFWGKTSFFSP